MSKKKLIGLFSTKDKTPKQLADQVMAQFRKHQQQQKQKYYCPDCKHEVTRVPLTSYTNEDGNIISIPYFGKAKCDNCPWQSEPFGGGLLTQEVIDPEKTAKLAKWREDQAKLSHFKRSLDSGKSFDELDAETRQWWLSRY
jgi:C4-type Zn-finger protein